VYGPRDSASFDYFKSAQRGLELLIGFHDTYVSLVHCRDIVSGIVLAAESKKSTDNLFPGSERYYTWDEIGYVTKNVLNRKTASRPRTKPLVFVVGGISQLVSRFKEKPSVLNFEKRTT